MVKLLVIADDFMKALDAGVHFAARGAKTRVVSDPDYDLSKVEASVLVLDAGTRQLSPEDAGALVHRIASAAKEAGIPHVYRKVGDPEPDQPTHEEIVENEEVPVYENESDLASDLKLNGRAPRRPKLPPSLFMICGSAHPVTRRQIKEAERCKFKRICLAVRQKLDPAWLASEGCVQAVERWAADNKARPRLILDANDEAADKATKQFAAENNLDAGQVLDRVSSALAGVTKELLDRGLEATLLCTDVDTLKALMAVLGAQPLTPAMELDKGIFLASFTYRKKAYHVIAKPGGLGEPDLLCRLAEQIGA